VGQLDSILGTNKEGNSLPHCVQTGLGPT